jgi:hypothetical protein
VPHIIEAPRLVRELLAINDHYESEVGLAARAGEVMWLPRIMPNPGTHPYQLLASNTFNVK